MVLAIVSAPVWAQTCTSVSLTPNGAFATASGGNATFSATGTPSNCNKTPVADASWITVSFGGGTANPSTIGYSVQANPGFDQRAGTITVNTSQFTVTQSGVSCAFTMRTDTGTAASTGATGAVSFTASNNICPWTATSSAPWLSVSPNSGTGGGSVSYTADPNPANVARSATITVGGAVFTLTQNPACSFSLSPAFVNAPSTAYTNTFTVTANANSCARPAVSDAAWLTIYTGASGTGNGTVGFNVAANTTGDARTGHITVGDAVFTASQSGADCFYAIAPANRTLQSGGGSGTFNLTTSCSWTASSTADWLVVGVPASGTGNASITYSVLLNPTAIRRNASILIGTAGFSVTQDGLACAVTINPTALDSTSDGGVGVFQVQAAQGCNWTATSNAGWITLTTGTSGTGEGSVHFTIAANTSPAARTGTITVSNQTFTVRQAGASCDYAIDPTSASIPSTPFSGSFAITTACSWAVSTKDSWITVTSGASGTGSGQINYSVASNASAAQRTGTITVANRNFSVIQAGVVCTLTLSPASADVTGLAGRTRFNVNGATGCSWKPSTSVPWISIDGFSAANGSGSVDISVTANDTFSPRGGTITVADKTFTINQAAGTPLISKEGFANAATNKAGPVSPGLILVGYGSLAGPAQLATFQLAGTPAAFTTSLAGTKLLFDGVEAPMVYTSSGQFSAIVPYAVAGKTTTKVQLEYLGVRSNEVTLDAAAAAPGIFTINQTGTGPGAVLNQDFSVNSATNQAARNSTIQIFATGEGQTRPVGVDGRLTPLVAPFPAAMQNVTVTVGGIAARVVYSGGAPGLVAGVIQINATLAANTPVGAAVPIVVRVGTADSPAGVTVAVK